MLKNGLYVVATPIGNLNDISSRALEVLRQADLIASEDTRVSRKLFKLLGLDTDKPFISYQDHNESQKAEPLVELLRSGKSVALISDAGSPLISDPGFKLVRQCRAQNVPVYTVPGACAVIAALQLSGLPTNRFMFGGFIPNKDKARLDLFRELCGINTTLVFYETAPRLLKTLAIMADVFKNREIAVVREISKIFEETKNGFASELLDYFTKNPPKGEIVVVIAPPTEEKELPPLESLLKNRLKKMSVKSAADEVAALTGISRKIVYTKALELKNE